MAVATAAGASPASAETGESSTSATSSSTSSNDTTANDTTAGTDTDTDTSTDAEATETDESDSPAEEVDDETEESTTEHNAGESGSDSDPIGHATKRKARPAEALAEDPQDTTVSIEAIEGASARPADAAPIATVSDENDIGTTSPDAPIVEAAADDLPQTVAISTPLTTSATSAAVTTTGAPVAPATPAVLLGVMDWIRREMDRFFDNDLPIPDPRQVVQGTGTGVVVGTMNTTDEENDRLSFIVTDQAKYGRVTVYSDGTWVYTPTKNIPASLTATGWTDSFNIRVIDRGFTLRKIQELFRGDAPGVSLPVTVTVAGYTGTPVQTAGTTQLLSAGAVSAAAASASATVTQRFEVVNASSRPIKLLSYGEHLQNQVTLSPPEGAILQPGEKHEFDVVFYFLGLGQVNPTYSTLDGSATWKMRMAINLWTVQESRCEVSGAGACNKYGTPLVMMDQPGGKIEIAAGQGQKQAEALNLLCNGSAPATCSFTVKQQDKTAYAAQREVWSYRTVADKAEIERSIEFTNSTSQSVEIGAKAGVTIKTIVELELSAKYTAKLDETVKNSTTIKTTVPPWTHKVLLAEQAVTRYTGDFTVKLGNTTYFLRDVYFDVPDSARAVRYREESTPVPH